MTEPPTLTPLWRNRDFVLLQTGRLLSHGGSEMTSVAYPLLALALTGLAAKAGIVAFARMLPATVAIPVSDSVLDGYRLAITSDRLVGRVESARRTISLLVAPLGPLAAGFLLEAVSARETIAVFTAASVALAVTGTLSPAIRNAPSLAEPVPDG